MENGGRGTEERTTAPEVRRIRARVSAASSGNKSNNDPTPFNGVTENVAALSIRRSFRRPLPGLVRIKYLVYPEFRFATLRALFLRPPGLIGVNRGGPLQWLARNETTTVINPGLGDRGGGDLVG